MKRRNWLKIAGPVALISSPRLSMAKESTGRWSDESRIKYSGLLLSWLEHNFAERAKTLELHTGQECKLDYDYLTIGDDRKKERLFEKFKEGGLSDRQANEHIERSLAEYEKVRRQLEEQEKKAAAEWKPKTTSIKLEKGDIYGTGIEAGRLTVILDNSRSMTPYLEKLRTEISRDFSRAYFVEVNGCHLDRNDGVPWFYSAPAPGINPFTADRHIPKVPQLDDSPYSEYIGWTRELPSAIDCMIDLMKADVIYWFCDFDDDDNDAVVKALARKILDQKIRLFVHTVDRRPPTLISLLAEKSGGAVIKKRI
ncbi:MAG: hypothetical protein ACSHYB_07485 [Roseibacillus sp.]